MPSRFPALLLALLLPLVAPASPVTPARPPGSIEVMVESGSLHGTIGTQPIRLDSFRIVDGRIDGFYCHARDCQTGGVPRLRLDGGVNAQGQALIDETVDGVASGRWTLRRTADGWRGDWLSPDGRRRLPVDLRADGPRGPWEPRVFLDGPLPAQDDACMNTPGVVAIGIHRDGHRVQVLPAESQGSCDPYLPEVVDLDFDGHADLMLAQFLPAGPNIPYQYWRQDPRTGLFEDISDLLGAVTSPEFDPARQLIHTFSRGGAASHGVSVWRWVDGRLQEVETRGSWFLDVRRNGRLRSCYVLPEYRDGRIVETPRIIDGADGRLRLEPDQDCQDADQPQGDGLLVWRHTPGRPPRAETISTRWYDRGPEHARRWCRELPVLDLDHQRIDWVKAGESDAACERTRPGLATAEG